MWYISHVPVSFSKLSPLQHPSIILHVCVWACVYAYMDVHVRRWKECGRYNNAHPHTHTHTEMQTPSGAKYRNRSQSEEAASQCLCMLKWVHGSQSAHIDIRNIYQILSSHEITAGPEEWRTSDQRHNLWFWETNAQWHSLVSTN